jgi:two-component system phosphate regulon sensor histidine kinase PhoR
VIAFAALVVLVGGGTLFALERSLADDLTAALDSRLTKQAYAVAAWLANTDHGDPQSPRLAGRTDRLAVRLAAVTSARITVVDAAGAIEGDSQEPDAVGMSIGDAAELAFARRGGVGHAVRSLGAGPLHYVVAVPGSAGRVIRLAVPVDDLLATRDRMRDRLLVGAALGFVGCIVLSWVFIRALTRPLQAMTRSAERLARGDYTAPPAVDSAGELGVLARAMNRMTGEVEARVRELTCQRDLLGGVISGLVEGVVVVGRDRRVVLVNAAARPLVSEGELPTRLLPLVRRALAGEPADDELELVGRAVRASARPLGPGRGERGAILVLYDVTRLRVLEGVRREFLANAAHELRTPVTSISGYAETLLGGAVDAETSQEFLATIHRNAQRLAALLSDLLVLDTLEGRAAAIGDRAPIRLAEIVEDAVRTARGVAPAASIEVDVAADLAVLGTRDGLEHIVQNLIDNAVKYGAETPVLVTARRTGARIQLAVRDRGPGIPAGHEDRVFARFYRLDAGRSRDRGGSGLGLAIVKLQSEAAGGRVWVEQARPGARFVVELDAA